jgi:putative tryptophan/tyrosine transport system substrate-binding protein
MRRRDAFLFFGAAAAGWPCVALGQTTPRMVRVGMASQNPRSAPFTRAFEKRLRELGYVEGQNLTIEFIDTLGQVDRIAEAMEALVRRNVDILLAGGPEASLKAALAATTTLPIVMIAIDYDPFALGYVKSLARPGGQVTGIYFQQTELAGKRLELMKEALPQLKTATVFWDRFSADQWKATQAATPRGLDLIGIDLGDQPYSYESAIAQAPPNYRACLFVMTSPVVFRDRERLATFALGRRIATMFVLREHVVAGGLISYGAAISSLYSRAAEFVDRIARGATPADLPIEQPTKFELVVNLSTAKALGLSIPPTLLARADEVIE